MKVGDIVVFKHPAPDEKGLKMRVVELRGERVLVVALVPMRVQPQHVYLVKDLKKA